LKKDSLVFHITTRKAWENAISEGGYQPPSLDMEGFIHCSFHYQLESTARRYFQGRSDLVLLWIDPARLSVEMKVEGRIGQEEQFPHIYGRLNLKSVVRITEFDASSGQFFD